MTDPDQLGEWIDAVLDRAGEQVAAYREGKRGLVGWFVAQVVAASGGRAEPQTVARLLEERLKQSG